jgi:hypothetical protein
MPLREEEPVGFLHLHCRGNVVRVEEVGERRGVAASICELWSTA